MSTRICWLRLLALLLATLQASVVSAQAVREIQAVLQQKPKPVQSDLVHNSLVRNTFTPPLKKVLTAELHFVKKICNPTDEQFDKIHVAGLAKVNELAQLSAIQQRARTKSPDLSDPNGRIASALVEAVKEILPSETAARYAEEIEARVEARRAATVGVIVTLIDQQVLLDPAQQESLAEALRENWNHDWSSAQIAVMYPMYATLPDADLLDPQLTTLQKKLWTYRPGQRNVRLPWDFEFNVTKMLGMRELEAFPDPQPGETEAVE